MEEKSKYQRFSDSETYAQDDEDHLLPHSAHFYSLSQGRYAYIAALRLLESVRLSVMMYIHVVWQSLELVTAANSKSGLELQLL